MNINLSLPSPNDPNFPAALKAARKALGVSASELSRRAGISSTMVARYENPEREDHHCPRQSTVTLLQQALRDVAAGNGVTNEVTAAKPSTDAALSLADVPLDALIEEFERRGFSVTITRSATR